MTKLYPLDNSGTLFDHIKQKKKLRLEGDLAMLLGEHPSIISEIRHGRRFVNAELLVRICENTGMSIKAVKAMLNTKKENHEPT